MPKLTNSNKNTSKFVTLEISPAQAKIIDGLVRVELLAAQMEYQEGMKFRDVEKMDRARDHAHELSKISDRIEAHA
ncbi:MAG: hypothetical protein NVS3B3_18590 [Aquirhabdus sp.]